MVLHYPKHFLVLFSKACILTAGVCNTEENLVLLDSMNIPWSEIRDSMDAAHARQLKLET